MFQVEAVTVGTSSKADQLFDNLLSLKSLLISSTVLDFQWTDELTSIINYAFAIRIQVE